MGQFWRKLARLRKRDEIARRLREELDFHVEMKSREHVAGGAEPAEALGQARRDVGNRARILEEAHRAWSFERLERVAADLRYAVRAHARAPAFFLLAALGTGLGVAAITSVLSVADAALVRAMPYRNADRLVVLWDQLPKLGLMRFPLSIANYLDYRAQNRVFDDLAACEPRDLTVVMGDRAERLRGMRASWNLLALLGGSMALGRWFEPRDNHAGQARLVVLSHAFWQTRFGGARDAIGRSLRIDDQPYAVAGVLQEGFNFRLSGEVPEVWIPADLDPEADRNAGALRGIARLKPGVTAVEAHAQMQLVAAGLKRRYRTGVGPHGEDAGYTVAVAPLREELYGAARPALYLLAGASAILLLLALANTAILWLGRAAARRREAAVRLALGASRGRIAQQLLIEALLASLAGGALALALTFAALHAWNRAPREELETLGRLGVNYRVFGFASGLSAAAGILFGALPLRSLFRAGAAGEPLSQDRGGIADRGESRLRPVLAAVQVGLSCALLVPSLLLVESLAALEHVNPGFRTGDLLTANVSLPSARYRDAAQIAGYYRRLEEALGAWRGASNVALASRLPLDFGPGGDPFSIEGRAYGASGTVPQFAHQLLVGQQYFRLMGIPVLAGRVFDARDFSEPTGAAVINEALARAFWPRESPLGQRILIGAPRPGVAWMTIVGTVADIHTEDLSRPPLPQIYRPFPQSPTLTMAVIAGGWNSGGAPIAGLERVLRSVDPAAPAYAVKSMEQRVAGSLDRPRFRTALFTAYGLLAFALAAFGIYSLAVYSGARRRREFALRAALGATAGRLLAAMLADTLRPAVLGAAAGLAAAHAMARALAAFLYGASASDPRVYLIAALVALAVALLAAGLGSRRYLAADPAAMLRTE